MKVNSIGRGLGLTICLIVGTIVIVWLLVILKMSVGILLRPMGLI